MKVTRCPCYSLIMYHRFWQKSVSVDVGERGTGVLDMLSVLSVLSRIPANKSLC